MSTPAGGEGSYAQWYGPWICKNVSFGIKQPQMHQLGQTYPFVDSLTSNSFHPSDGHGLYHAFGLHQVFDGFKPFAIPESLRLPVEPQDSV